MTKEIVERELREIIVKYLEIAEENISAAMDLEKDLGADSLDIVEIVMALEDKYNIKVRGEDQEKIKTFGNLVDLVAAKA